MNKFSLKFREIGRTSKYLYAENVNNKASINQKILETKHPACKWGSAPQTLKHLLAVIYFPLPKEQ